MALSALTEKYIEDFLCENPYLIDPVFKNVNPTRQEKTGRYRTDLTLRHNGLLTIVEIKKVILNQDAIEQLLNYKTSFKKIEKLSKYHYLIGKPPKKSEEFRKDAIRKNVRVLYLGSDIPPAFLFDTKERIYVPHDESLVGKRRYIAPVWFAYD